MVGFLFFLLLFWHPQQTLIILLETGKNSYSEIVDVYCCILSWNTFCLCVRQLDNHYYHLMYIDSFWPHHLYTGSYHVKLSLQYDKKNEVPNPQLVKCDCLFNKFVRYIFQIFNQPKISVVHTLSWVLLRWEFGTMFVAIKTRVRWN